MELRYTSHYRSGSIRECMVKPDAQGSNIISSGAKCIVIFGDIEPERQLRADSGDVVRPEDAAELGEIAFVEVGVAGGGVEGLVADLYVEGVGFGVDDDVGAVDGEFLVDAVADGGGEA